MGLRKSLHYPWTEERVRTLRALWAEGQSASYIAKRLGGVTRNAVIGKVTRLGLPGRATKRLARTVVRRRRPVAPIAQGGGHAGL